MDFSDWPCTYINTGCWTRDPQGKSCMDVAVYDSQLVRPWRIADVRELL
jgi:hypothetical protein